MAARPAERTDPPAPSPEARLRSRWWFAAVAAALLVGETLTKFRSGTPFAVSILDALVLVALAVVIGTYVILARAERDHLGPEAQEREPPADHPSA